jgi:hypothetical protein
MFRGAAATVTGIFWGMTLLGGPTYVLTRSRKVSATSEVVKHLAVALIVVFISKAIGHWITTHVISKIG